LKNSAAIIGILRKGKLLKVVREFKGYITAKRHFIPNCADGYKVFPEFISLAKSNRR